MAGRTKMGVLFEMEVHFVFTKIGKLPRMDFLYSKMYETDIGNTLNGSPAYDYNANWFEKPLRSIPEIVKFFIS